MWVTNNTRVFEYIEDLMTRSGLTLKGTWTWLKIAASGDTVYPLGNPHKNPSEKLLFYAFTENPICIESKSFVSIPTKIHSQKPFLHEKLEEQFPNHTKKVEIFARCIIKNWTSIGNEVLYLNDSDFYTAKNA